MMTQEELDHAWEVGAIETTDEYCNILKKIQEYEELSNIIVTDPHQITTGIPDGEYSYIHEVRGEHYYFISNRGLSSLDSKGITYIIKV